MCHMQKLYFIDDASKKNDFTRLFNPQKFQMACHKKLRIDLVCSIKHNNVTIFLITIKTRSKRPKIYALTFFIY